MTNKIKSDVLKFKASLLYYIVLVYKDFEKLKEAALKATKEQALTDGRPTRRGRKDIHFHDLGIETMTEAILSIDEPILTAQVTSKDGNPTIVMALPVLGKNDAPLCAVLSFYSNKPINGNFEIKPHIVLTITTRDFFDTTPGRQGWKEFIDNAVKERRILDYDKEKGSVLSVIPQQTGLGNVTEASLTNNIAQFKKFVNDFKEKIRSITIWLNKRKKRSSTKYLSRARMAETSPTTVCCDLPRGIPFWKLLGLRRRPRLATPRMAT